MYSVCSMTWGMVAKALRMVEVLPIPGTPRTEPEAACVAKDSDSLLQNRAFICFIPSIVVLVV